MTNELHESSGACAGTGKLAALDAAGCLSLAAAPVFAIMALLTGMGAWGAPVALCSAAHDASPLSGMALMYVLMCVFHLAPWLRLIDRR